MKSIYIISSPEMAEKNLFKVGKHTGTPNDLINRYQTAIPNVNIYFFQHLENADEIENEIKNRLYEFRTFTQRSMKKISEGCDSNSKINKTEWFNTPFLNLHKHLKKIINCENEIIIDVSENYPGLRFNSYNLLSVSLMKTVALLTCLVNKNNIILIDFKRCLFSDLKYNSDKHQCGEFTGNIRNIIPDTVEGFLIEFKNKEYSPDEKSYFDDIDQRLKIMKKSLDEIDSLSPKSKEIIDVYCNFVLYNNRPNESCDLIGFKEFVSKYYVIHK
ncbi:hypothetical protein [Moumouvirus maliensis]|nr:hypothetical protein [Moumouvirus maliensis]